MAKNRGEATGRHDVKKEGALRLTLKLRLK